LERLQRILASRGVASRRAAEVMIQDGRIAVNGRIITELGTKADPVADEIRVDGNIIRQQALRYLMMNKPTGYITTTSDERDRWTVMDLIRVPERVFPVGRLDRDTEGLLLFTNDGDIAHRIMHPRFKLTKEYHVLTPGRPTDQQLQRIRAGVLIDTHRIVPEEIRLLRESSDGIILTITVHEGVNHLVRRIMEVAGIEVERLRRARVGPISLSGLRIGEWRDLSAGELGTLTEALRMDDEQLARQANRQVRTSQGGTQPPANPLWKRPKRVGDNAKPANEPTIDFEKREVPAAGTDRDQVTDGADREENARNERKPRTDRRPSSGERPQRDSNRRSRGVRKVDGRSSSSRSSGRRIP
jgi:23S rRNA pseudouridine2605 synthase